MIARLNYNENAPPRDLVVTLPGWVYKVSRVFYCLPHFEILDEEIPRVKAQIVETKQLLAFGTVLHECAKKSARNKRQVKT